MIVLDASAAVELLIDTALGRQVADRIASADEALHAPHLLAVEVSQALRRLVRIGDLEESRGSEALSDLRDLDVTRHGHEFLLERVWALRANVTAYDAVYVALAEALDAPLVTCDGSLAAAPAIAARVELLGPGV